MVHVCTAYEYTSYKPANKHCRACKVNILVLSCVVRSLPTAGRVTLWRFKMRTDILGVNTQLCTYGICGTMIAGVCVYLLWSVEDNPFRSNPHTIKTMTGIAARGRNAM